MNLSTFMSTEWHFIDEVGQQCHQWQKSQDPHSQDKWILILVMTLLFSPDTLIWVPSPGLVGARS